jgi:hypothetical protein
METQMRTQSRKPQSAPEKVSKALPAQPVRISGSISYYDEAARTAT